MHELTRPVSRILAIVTALTMSWWAPLPAGASTLSTVKERGFLNCGVNPDLPGFSAKTDSGTWSGFDVDFCKAVASAIFLDASKVAYIPLSATARFEALKSGTIDVLYRNSTWTLEREAMLGLLFAGITYHDGQSFLVARKPEVTSALELDGATVCVQASTTSKTNLSDFFKNNSMQYHEVVVQTASDAIRAIASGQCDVFTADQSALYSERRNLRTVKDVSVLPDVISKEPLGPATRADDIAWFNIIRGVNIALINAEELGISQSTADAARQSKKPEVMRFVGADGTLGQVLGLDPTWAINAVRSVGHYGEIFERNLGTKSDLAIPRGLNNLWSMGGDPLRPAASIAAMLALLRTISAGPMW